MKRPHGIAMSPLHLITSSVVARNVGTYLASKQDVRLLDVSSRDQFIGEFSKGSSNGDGSPPVSTFFAHVSCSVATRSTRSQSTKIAPTSRALAGHQPPKSSIRETRMATYISNRSGFLAFTPASAAATWKMRPAYRTSTCAGWLPAPPSFPTA
jgi:hypothetical protein